MGRYYVDCRDYPSTDAKCSVAIAADTKDELLEVAVQHAVKAHGFKDTSEFRNELKKGFKEGTPPA